MMFTIGQNILAALGGATAVILLIAAACWKLIASGLATWLTKRVGKGLERDADRYKHELSRDMETYKNELVRSQSIERVRAEMRKVVAEKLFERRLNAYHDLYVAISEIPSYILSQAMQPIEFRFPLENVFGRAQDFQKTLIPHQLYLPSEFKQEYRSLLSELLTLFAENSWAQRPALALEDQTVVQINQRVAALNFKLDQYYKSLPDELANAIVQQ
ncbi:hypothetical protein [Burkholderia orbicola]|uniref:hypothetical protein n=1 Tax=Burkholderia orbicola TaxID=2978683 RepID=UPI0026516B54|nr:hypothetical protein [Burkholderia orbicola]MDN7467015.1 hypothetical protein [Burkholderia orbicola]